MTLCIGQHHDDALGIPKLLGVKAAGKGSSTPCIADDFNAINRTGSLLLLGGESVDTKIKLCLDLAAARGLRGSRGKSACLCTCSGKDKHQYPGNGTSPAVPDGDSLDTWHRARAILKRHCTYGAPIMTHSSLREATHQVPSNWEFDRDGAWRCRHCDRDGFHSWSEYLADKAALEALRTAANGGDKQAVKDLAAILKEHADGHLDVIKYHNMVLDVNSDDLITDPLLHALQLNIAKVAFKYSFRDMMDDVSRDQTTAYLQSIGICLDLREKGQRNHEQKWMTGATVDDYVLGQERDVKSKSPGLSVNTAVLCDIVYGRMTKSSPPPPSSSNSSSSQPTTATVSSASTTFSTSASKRRQPPQSRRRRIALLAACNAGAAACDGSLEQNEDNESNDSEELCQMQQHDEDNADSAEMRQHLPEQYGSHAANVAAALHL
eukprot:3926421-Pleurochrysis_carterae.AAC.3